MRSVRPHVGTHRRRTTSFVLALTLAAVGAVPLAATATVAQAAPTALEPCAAPTGQAGYTDPSYGTASMAVRSTDPTTCRRVYTLTRPGGQTVTITEPVDKPIVRTGSAMLDGVFALAVQEAGQDSIDNVSNGSYNGGNPMSCVVDGVGCYYTGAGWTYVWTRDTAYSAALGLGSIDPLRIRNSLTFKLSDRRAGWYSDTPDVQILQDSGTGGSYPNSTDRVSWALGAEETVDWLPEPYRSAFKDTSYTALRNTIEHDRKVVYDTQNHLYSGETSFLDWRWQTYPDWIERDMTQIAQSMSLSTNVDHWVAITETATLAAEHGDTAAAATYRSWADDLAETIRTRFWLPEQQQFSALVTGTLDPSPTLRYDALGTALVVLTGIATPEQAAAAVAGYPQTYTGPATIWPQQSHIWDNRSGIAYHNYATWPFLTAFMMRAAAAVGNDTSATSQLSSIVRVPAVFGSNYENINVLSGGTNTNLDSQRQLWSVAGAMSAFQQSMFGIDPDDAGLHVSPFVTAQQRHQWFSGSSTIALDDLSYQGRKVDIEVVLPADTAQAGAYTVSGLSVNGASVPVGSAITPEQLGTEGSDATVTVTLGAARPSVTAAADVNTKNERAITGPDVPTVSSVTTTSSGTITLGIDLGGSSPNDVSMDVLRDGVVVANDVEAATTFVDTRAAGMAYHSYCYSVRLTDHATGNTSQPAKASCYWGTGSDRVLTADSSTFQNVGGAWADKTIGGVTHRYVKDWGNLTTDSLTATVTATRTGHYLAQVKYAVNTNPIPDGISSGIKMLTVKDHATGDVVTRKPIVLSNTGDWNLINGSTFVPVDLVGGRTYELVLAGDRVAVNMGYFQANAVYAQGSENLSTGPRNFNDVYAMQLLLKDVGDLAVSARADASITAGGALSGTLASVSGGLADAADDLTTTVAWGDGSTSTPATTAVGAGTFSVSGSHTYASPGTYRARVTVGDGATTQSDDFVVTVKAGTLASSTPAITGTVQVGKTLRAVPGSWGPGTVLTYRWYADGERVAGSTGATLRLAAAQRGARIMVAVTGTAKNLAPVTRTSRRTVAVAAGTLGRTKVSIGGKARVGKKLRAKITTGGPAPVTVSCRWYRAGKAIKGATGTTLRLKGSYRGARITVKVTTKKSGYTTTTTSARTGKVRR